MYFCRATYKTFSQACLSYPPKFIRVTSLFLIVLSDTKIKIRITLKLKFEYIFHQLIILTINLASVMIVCIYSMDSAELDTNNRTVVVLACFYVETHPFLPCS